jgi:hypothetical protein
MLGLFQRLADRRVRLPVAGCGPHVQRLCSLDVLAGRSRWTFSLDVLAGRSRWTFSLTRLKEILNAGSVKKYQEFVEQS